MVQVSAATIADRIRQKRIHCSHNTQCWPMQSGQGEAPFTYATRISLKNKKMTSIMSWPETWWQNENRQSLDEANSWVQETCRWLDTREHPCIIGSCIGLSSASSSGRMLQVSVLKAKGSDTSAFQNQMNRPVPGDYSHICQVRDLDKVSTGISEMKIMAGSK